MNLMRFSTLLIFIVLTGISAVAQQRNELENTDEENAAEKKSVHSPDSVLVSYFFLNEQGSYQRYTVSKPLNHFQEYDVTKQNNQFYATLGNAGSASSPLLFKVIPSSDFRFRSDVFEPYALKDDSIRFFISESPFSHLRYHLGPAKEQKLNLNFSQRIGSGIYLGLNARFANSPGIYLRQRGYHSGGTFYVAFLYPTQRYGALITYRNDRMLNFENGGVANIDNFIQNTESNRKVIQVNLQNATNSSKTSSLVFQQFFNILKPTVVQKTDTSTVLVPRKFDAGRFVHTLRYTRTGTSFEDPSATNNGFYPSYFYDTIPVFDSVFHSRLENCLVYSNEVPDTLGKSFPLQYSFGIRFQTDRIRHNNPGSDIFTQTVPFGMLKGIIKQKTFFKASAYLVFGGYKSGNYSIDGSFYQFFGKQNYKAYLNVSKGLMQPDYYFNHYYTHYLEWNNSFSAQDYLKGEFGINFKGFDLKASYTRMTNYVYLDQNILPDQYHKPLSILAGHASKEFRMKHWITTVYAAAQQFTPDSILRLPALIGKLTICYDIELFKKALHAQAGISGTYHSQWFQDAYMPALRAFYHQKNFVAGNYPYLDAFVNLNIKRARLFVKYEHFNAGLFNYNYIMVPDYPQADAALKFGISWLFFD